MKVTVTTRGELDPGYRFFTTGDVEKLVYCATPALDKARDRLAGVATVLDGGDPLSMPAVVTDLGARGIGRLMVEGGGGILTRFLGAGLADELRLAIAPFFVGDSRAPRFVHDGAFPWRPDHPARLAGVDRLDDLVLLRYALSERFMP